MGVQAERWLAKYQLEYPDYELAAQEVKKQVEDAVTGHAYSVHSVHVRAKRPDSVAEKVKRRNYRRPAIQFDDLLGVRVITLFDHTVKDVAERLSKVFDVDERRSADKTSELRIRQVGYRSHHLVLKARRTGIEPIRAVIEKTFVEVQVRSVVAHAWAEIEHSLRYKVGEGVPEELARRFDALAGTLELVDREFSSIEASTVELILRRSELYANGEGLEDTISTLQLLALLQSENVKVGLGPRGLKLPIEDAFRLAKVVVQSGMSSVGSLREALHSGSVRRIVREYSEQKGLDPDDASALVLLGAAIGARELDLVRGVDLLSDPVLVEILEGASTPEATSRPK